MSNPRDREEYLDRIHEVLGNSDFKTIDKIFTVSKDKVSKDKVSKDKNIRAQLLLEYHVASRNSQDDGQFLALQDDGAPTPACPTHSFHCSKAQFYIVYN